MKLDVSVESTLECAAAASFGACVAYSAWLVAPTVGVNPLLLMLGGGAVGYFGAIAGVQSVGIGPFSVPGFTIAPIETAEPDELLLTEAVAAGNPDRFSDEAVLTLEQRWGVNRHAEEEAEVLLLDDMLTQADPDSRVVRLFDPAAIPTPGALRSRIDRHLQDQQTSGYPDAAQALNDALAELRRSLR